MVSHKIFAAVIALSLITLPATAMAQTGAGNETNGHHYSGGPKTEVPHHMGRKETTVGVSAAKGNSDGHHYNGGLGSTIPHHMGDRQ
jgi:hypothetical protein